MQRDRIGYTLDYCLSLVDAGAGEASTRKTFQILLSTRLEIGFSGWNCKR